MIEKTITEILEDAGYSTVTGASNVISAIGFTDDSTKWLCSGYGVFPDGTKCEGCTDCKKEN